MRIVQIFFVAAFCLCFAMPAAAQYIGVLQSAETMDRGTFKLSAAPIMVFGKNGADDEFGLAARGRVCIHRTLRRRSQTGLLREQYLRRRGWRVLDFQGY